MAETFNAFNFGEEYDKADFGTIDAGTYEVTIDEATAVTSKSGKPMVKIAFKIRSDVEQNFKNRKLWYYIVKNDDDPCYNFNKINKLIMTQPDFPKRIETFDEVLFYLNGKNLKIEVYNEFSDTTGKEESRVKDYSFAKSEAKVVASDTVDLPTDDLPF